MYNIVTEEEKIGYDVSTDQLYKTLSMVPTVMLLSQNSKIYRDHHAMNSKDLMQFTETSPSIPGMTFYINENYSPLLSIPHDNDPVVNMLINMKS